MRSSLIDLLAMKHRICNILMLVLMTGTVMADELTDYTTFLHRVATQNAAYLAEQYNIDIALAEEQTARVFRDPELSFSYANNEDWSIQMGQTFDAELSYTIPLGGERVAGIRAAEAQTEVTCAAVADYLRGLRLQAAEAYAEAWLSMQTARLLRSSYQMMSDIAHSDSIRLSMGDVDLASAMQSTLEARITYSEWQNAEVAYQNALSMLSLLIGGEPVNGIADSTLVADPLPTASLGELQTRAIANRADLIQAVAEQRLTEQQLRVVRAMQHTELTLTAGYTHAMRVRNEEAPAPAFDGFSVGFAIPLKFSSINRGAVRAAKAQVMQAEQNVRAMEQQVRTEVEQAYRSYAVRAQLMAGFRSSILTDAATILRHRTEGYRRGDSSLMELISARATYNELYQSYLDNCAAAFVAQAALSAAIGE